MPRMLRLAHSLDAGGLLGSADAALAGQMKEYEAALRWLPLADEHELHDAWAVGIRCARRWRGSLPTA